MKSALDLVLSANWAILPETLDTIASIAAREHEYAGRLDALAAELGRPLGNTMRATVRDGVALVPVEGPLFRRANLMTDYSGATSYESLARDFTAAVNDPSIHSIILWTDSPGGEVNGASEFAKMVRAARDAGKTIVTYIGGTGASAAYWIGSAAGKIYAADTAVIGSIGVQSGFTVRDARPGERAIRFVSSQSPLKNADPETEAGAKEAQATVDGLATVFVDTVASNRGVSAETVLADYGQGGVFVAAKALEQGMIDGITTLEALISQLQQDASNMDYSSLTAEQLAEKRPDLVSAIGSQAVAKAQTETEAKLAAAKTEGATAERDRITGIIAAAQGIAGADDIVAAAIKDPAKSTASVTVELLTLAKAALAAGTTSAQTTKPANPAAAHLENLAATETGMQVPTSAAAPTNTPVADAEGATAEEIEAARARVKAIAGQGVTR